MKTSCLHLRLDHVDDSGIYCLSESVRQYFNENQMEILDKAFRLALEERKSIHFEMQLCLKLKGRFTCFTSIQKDGIFLDLFPEEPQETDYSPFDEYPSGVLIFNFDKANAIYKLGYHNKSAKLFFANDLLSEDYLHFEQVISGKDAQELKASIDRCRTTDKAIIFNRKDIRIGHNNGYFRINLLSLKSDKVVVIFEDITQKESLVEESRQLLNEFKALFHAMTDAVFIMDQHGRYVKFLPTSDTLLYKSRDILLGKTVKEVFDSKMAAFFMKNIKKCIEKQEVVKLEYKLDINGKEVWFDAYLSPLDEQNLVFIARDISLRKRAELALRESEERYRALFENSSSVMIIIDPESGNICAANATASLFYGYPQGELLDLKLDDLDCSGGFDYYVSLHQETLKTSVITRHRLANGNERDVELFPCKLSLNGSPQIHIIIHDITERTKATHELKLSSQKLSDANATKSKFFNIIAHDLKDPFNAILGFSSLLYDEFDRYNEKEKKYFIHQINSATQGTYKLLENLLQWSRSQSGKIEYNPEQIDFCNVANNTVSSLKTQADQKSIKLHSSIPFGSMVYACENMVTTVLRNLITNAVKFTARGGQIMLTSRKSNGFLQVDVRDTGVGIRQDQLEKLFRIDTQYKTMGTENEKGSGLGLILCREFVEKNGGKIWVESMEGKGSIFSFTLPVPK